MKRATTLAAVLAIILMAGTVFGYTEVTRPAYIDYTPMGGTSITAQVPSNIYGTADGYGVIIDSMTMATSVQSATLTPMNGGTFYDPMIYSLDGAVQLVVGIPTKPGSTTFMKYFTPGDSYGVMLPGKYTSFVIWKHGTADSAAATGYVVIGRSGVPLTHTRLK